MLKTNFPPHQKGPSFNLLPPNFLGCVLFADTILDILLTLPKFNIEPEKDGSKRNFLLQGLIFRFHVKLQGCTVKKSVFTQRRRSQHEWMGHLPLKQKKTLLEWRSRMNSWWILDCEINWRLYVGSKRCLFGRLDKLVGLNFKVYWIYIGLIVT